MLGDKSPQEIYRNSSGSNINSAKMFIALNACPSFYVKLYWKTIYGPSSRISMLASNILKKAKGDFKIKALKIFAKMSSVLGFQHISYHHRGNRSIASNIDLSKNILDIKGDYNMLILLLNQYFKYIFSIDKVLLQTVSNHPVHILNDKREFSPSSFIPFCYFGDKFIGVSIQEFEIPVCNIFRPRIYLNQLCYETNLQDLKDSQKIGKQLEMGLTLVLDYNEERQNYNIKRNEWQTMYALYPHNNDASIYLDTISLLNF